jgi:hypothetical protein
VGTLTREGKDGNREPGTGNRKGRDAHAWNSFVYYRTTIEPAGRGKFSTQEAAILAGARRHDKGLTPSRKDAKEGIRESGVCRSRAGFRTWNLKLGTWSLPFSVLAP